MDHELINELVLLAKNLDPEANEFALSALAVIVEVHLRELEQAGTPITRESLHKTILATLEKCSEAA